MTTWAAVRTCLARAVAAVERGEGGGADQALVAVFGGLAAARVELDRPGRRA